MENKNITYWKQNAEEDYIGTPLSVLRYISELEKIITKDQEFETKAFWFGRGILAAMEGKIAELKPTKDGN